MAEDTVDRLFRILRHPDFLSMKGLSGEVPIFIHTYEATEEDAAHRAADALATRLRNDGIACANIDLFDLVLEQLEEEGRLDRIIAQEPQLGKAKLLETMTNLTDAKTRLVPRLMQRLETENASLSILTGVGRVYPFLRTHTILDSLQPAMMRQPVVMFFPGHYTQPWKRNVGEAGSPVFSCGDPCQPPQTGILSRSPRNSGERKANRGGEKGARDPGRRAPASDQ